MCKDHLAPLQANASEPIEIKCESDLACLLGKSKLLGRAVDWLMVFTMGIGFKILKHFDSEE